MGHVTKARDEETLRIDSNSNRVNLRCYVCRKTVPNDLNEVKAAKWHNITFGNLPIAVLCGDCADQPAS